MTHQTPNDNNPKCHLLRLPPEIRNEIYHLVFTPQEPICLSPILHCGAHHGTPKRFKVPALLRTSRQIRHEAAGLFYSKTTFVSHSSASTFAQCLKIIDKEHLKFFRKIEYRTHESVWAARLWLQVVADLLGKRGKLFGDGVIRAAYDPGYEEGEKLPEVCWIGLDQVRGKDEENRSE